MLRRLLLSLCLLAFAYFMLLARRFYICCADADAMPLLNSYFIMMMSVYIFLRAADDMPVASALLRAMRAAHADAAAQRYAIRFSCATRVSFDEDH